ncbi:AN1-type zinc finger protein 2A-like [Hydractinia symbiolongicarpus]|uniref:AN1-type zinc finger protein 2A-like n=1 Tax=Hydractinia symbiolongicarpus TaxID=13093 RepID=UPI00254BC404|nr:AN1-type zinc finger protein 2A-like [Hydractinia symbiolongicarpus]
MANSELFDMMSVGRHCNETFCKKLDFLPFKCDFCKKEFCLSHYKPNEHLCKEVKDQDSKLPSCPLCGKYLVKGRSDNDQVEKHILSGCQSLKATKRKKNRCSHTGCRNVNLIPLHCEKCLSTFCVRHRHPGDHGCINVSQQRLIKV